MAILTTGALIDAALGLFLDRSANGIVSTALAPLRKRSQRRELAVIVEAALDAAAATAPAFAPGLKDESFLHDTALPVVLDLIEKPSRLPDANAVASALVASLATGKAEAIHASHNLRLRLANQREELEAAFVVFATALRAGMDGSEAWRGVAHRQVTEAINANVVELVQYHRRAVQVAAPVGAEDAHRDAETASADLRDWPRDVWGAQIERPEFAELRSRIQSDPAGETLVVGDAGSGKSALLASLLDRLKLEEVHVLAIKADRLPADVRTLDDVSRALGMQGSLVDCLHALALEKPAVLVIDQLDAVSEVMDRTSDRMRLLLRLIATLHPGRSTDDRLPVHIVVSSRPFEADHDARFLRFEHERLTLRLPTADQVDAVLREVGIDPPDVPEPIRETIRRPFALKLFVGIAKRGGRLDDLLPSRLLARWMEAADLGDASMRREVGRLLTALAEEMIGTETLWRPVDVHRSENPEAFLRAVSTGLLVVDGDRVGFSHQSWLDDFQARGLADPTTLAQFAWAKQEGLFARASVLRALQRLRSCEPPAYEAAVNLLLGENATRRHLRHLVVDLLAGQDDPRPREAGWIERLLRDDPVLAQRAVPLVARHWAAWRPLAHRWLPLVMQDGGMTGVREVLLAAEVAADQANAIDLIDRHWSGSDYDGPVLLTIDRAQLWNDWAAGRLARAAGRAAVSAQFVSHFGRGLLKAGRPDDAVEMTAVFLVAVVEGGSDWNMGIHDLGKFVAASPLAFATRLLPAFVSLASRDAVLLQSSAEDLAESPALDWRWRRRGDGSPFEALAQALRMVAETQPEALTALLRPLAAVEVEAVQIVVADALAAGGTACAREGLDFLLSDVRRFDIGDAIGNGTDGVTRTVHGWSSRELVRAIAHHLTRDDLARLRDAIEAWSRYPRTTARDGNAQLRRSMLRWAEEARLALLAQLPAGVLDPRRQRQVEEWRARQPLFKGRMNSLGMASLVGSPMSATSMAQASDEQIVSMIESRHDNADERADGRRLLRGGARQLAQAFGEFAKDHPARAMTILGDLLPQRHEAVAGTGLRELAGVRCVEPNRVVELVRALASRGFASPSWRNEAGWALSTLARRLGGLPDPDIALLESWLTDDPEAVAARAKRREEAATESQRRDPGSDRRGPHPTLFGSFGGHVLVPQGNFTFLDAIGQGLLLRSEPDTPAFAGVLRRHAERAEEPAVWAHTLLSYGQVLWSLGDEDAHGLLRAILNGTPGAFDDPMLVGILWQLRSRFPEEVLDAVLDRWLAGTEQQRQAAGELVGGLAVLSLNEDPQSRRTVSIVAGGPSPERTGFAFSVVAAWSESDPVLRQNAHHVVVALAHDPDADVAAAIATAFSKDRALPPDQLTREVLDTIAANPVALEAALSHWLLDALGDLLMHPGFDEVVLTVLAAAVTLREGAPGRLEARGYGLGDDMVRLAIALQRSDGQLRSKAMDVYERLLDANAYGAAQAAEASLRRGVPTVG